MIMIMLNLAGKLSVIKLELELELPVDLDLDFVFVCRHIRATAR